MDRFIDTIEWVAAFFVGIVAAKILLQVLLRNQFNDTIPDSDYLGRQMLGQLLLKLCNFIFAAEKAGDLDGQVVLAFG